MSAVDLLAKARAMLVQGQAKAAVILLGAACVQDEFNAEAHAMLGHAYLAIKDPHLAIAPLKKALHLNPEHRLAHRDLNVALSLVRGPVSTGPWDQDPRLPTALAVGAAVLFGAVPWAVLGAQLHVPAALIVTFLGLVGGVALVGWIYLVSCARVSRPSGHVLIHGRRSVLSYWRHASVPLLLLVAIVLLAATRSPYALIPICVLAFCLKGALAAGALLCAPGARPLYMVVDHLQPGRRCLIVKQLKGLRQTEFQLLAVRIEQVRLERHLLDVLLGLWTLRVNLSHNAIPGVGSLCVKTPDHHRNAGRWRNEIARLISDGRRFISSGGSL